MEKKKKLAMAVFSGDLDKLFAAFSIASGAAASNMDVTMFFTFWGLRALKKKARTGKSVLGWFLRGRYQPSLAQQNELRRTRPLDVQKDDEGQARPYVS